MKRRIHELEVLLLAALVAESPEVSLNAVASVFGLLMGTAMARGDLTEADRKRIVQIAEEKSIDTFDRMTRGRR